MAAKNEAGAEWRKVPRLTGRGKKYSRFLRKSLRSTQSDGSAGGYVIEEAKFEISRERRRQNSPRLADDAARDWQTISINPEGSWRSDIAHLGARRARCGVCRCFHIRRSGAYRLRDTFDRLSHCIYRGEAEQRKSRSMKSCRSKRRVQRPDGVLCVGKARAIRHFISYSRYARQRRDEDKGRAKLRIPSAARPQEIR